MRIIDWSSDVCSSDLGIVPTAIAVSRTAWERLPAEYKTMLEELRPEAQRLVIDAYTEADARWIPAFKEAGQIGRDPGRERVCQEVEISVAGVCFKQK